MPIPCHHASRAINFSRVQWFKRLVLQDGMSLICSKCKFLCAHIRVVDKEPYPMPRGLLPACCVIVGTGITPGRERESGSAPCAKFPIVCYSAPFRVLFAQYRVVCEQFRILCAQIRIVFGERSERRNGTVSEPIARRLSLVECVSLVVSYY